MVPVQQRHPACIVWLSDLLYYPYVYQAGEFESNYLDFPSKRVSRVNIIATVISVFVNNERNYASALIDDGSAPVRLKVWKEDVALLSDLSVGNLVQVIGRPRQYNSELYLNPEVVKVLQDFHFEILRKLELLQMFGSPTIRPLVIPDTFSDTSFSEEVVSEVVSGNSRQKILDIVDRLGGNEGVPFDEVVAASSLPETEAEDIIQELLREGEIFEPSPSRLRII